MLPRFLTVSLMSAWIAGCAMDQAPLIINTSCFDFRPILPSRDDVLTRGTKEQIVANNETWERRCGPTEP